MVDGVEQQLINSLFFPTQEYIYNVLSCESMTAQVARILLQPSSDQILNYEAGQYLKVLHPDGKFSLLSIACAPQKNGRLELHLAHLAKNVLANQLLKLVHSEKKLTLQGPYGKCTASALTNMKKPLIFLARGTGFAPVKALVEAFEKFPNKSPLYLYWGATSPEEFYLSSLAKQWAQDKAHFFYIPVLSRPSPQWSGKTGRLQQLILQDHPQIENYCIYASAPEKIVREALDEFLLAGLPRAQYFSDV